MSTLLYYNENKSFYNDKSTHSAYLDDSGSIPLIRFRCFDNEDWMKAALTTKLGGVSTGHLASLNLGLGRGDSDENVYENYKRVADSFLLPAENMLKTDQVHSDTIAFVDENVLPAGPLVQKYTGTDGFYTNVPNLALCISVADCVPIILADPVTKSIACVHSGWRGTVSGIGAKAVKYLSELDANPKDIIALIGPSISQKNYEVTFDVIDEFKKKYSESEMKNIAYQTDDIHYQLDLWAACYYSLERAGLAQSNIHFSSVCTYDNHELLYSHRYTNGLRGNLNAIACILDT